MDSIRQLATIAAVAFFCICGVARCLNEDIVSEGCSPVTFPPGSAYTSSVEQVLNYLKYKTADLGYNCYTQSGAGGSRCYGHGACNGDLAVHDDCTSCIKHAIDMITAGCSTSVGGQIQLQDCRVRYENYDFSE